MNRHNKIKKVVICLCVLMTVFMSRPSNAFAPAIALLNPAVLGSVVVAGGVMAGAAAHYAPAVYEAGQVAVDTMANFSRILYQAEKFALTSGVQYAVGRLEQATLDLGNVSGDAWNYIKSHLPDLPTLAGVWSALNTPKPQQYDGHNLYDCSLVGTGVAFVCGTGNLFNFSNYFRIGSNTQIFDPYYISSVQHLPGQCQTYYGQPSNTTAFYLNVFYYCVNTSSNTLDLTKSLDLRSPAYNPLLVTPAVPASQTPADISIAIGEAIAQNAPTLVTEIDKVIAANPGAVTGVPPWTSADSGAAQKIAAGQVAKDAAIVAKAASDADPTNTALKIAATEAQERADQKAIEAQTPVDTPLDLSGTYNPESLTNDYTPDTALNKTSEFTDRFNTFVGDIKATPLFSLPNQVLFNIPNSSTSIYTVNMGSYGTVDIDFSSFGSALTIFRSSLLICFAYASLRIAATGK